MRLLAFALIVLASTFAVAADEVPREHVDAFLKRSAGEKARFLRAWQGLVDRTEKHLAAAKRGTLKTGSDGRPQTVNGQLVYRFGTAAEKKDAVAELTEKKKRLDEGLELAKKGKSWPIPQLGPLVLRLGTIVADDVELKVIQVIDANNFIGLQDVGGTRDDIDVWVTGFATSKMVDGTTVRLGDGTGLVYIRGTKSYTTAIGAKKTIIQLSPLAIDALRGSIGKDENFLGLPK